MFTVIYEVGLEMGISGPLACAQGISGRHALVYTAMTLVLHLVMVAS
jgi:hypothetical protein